MAIPEDKRIELDRFLEKLSTEELKRLLREELALEETGSLRDELLMTKVTEVVVQREIQASVPPEFDVKAAWEEFKQDRPSAAQGPHEAPRRYARNLPNPQAWSGPEASPKAPRFRAVLRRVAVAAALLALLMAGMVLAQAAGADVFGRLAQWTDEIFYFVSPQSGCTSPLQPFQQALEGEGIAGEYAPTWYPERFQASQPQVWNTAIGSVVQIDFTDPSGASFSVSAERTYEPYAWDVSMYEKDTRPVETYVTNGRCFYIFHNLDDLAATWADETICETIVGNISIEEMKAMLDSIGRDICGDS